MHLTLPDSAKLSLDRPVIVGVLNVTPDSFSDGGEHAAPAQAAAHAQRMVTEGADVIDIGGESTRPGAGRVLAEEQLRRLLPVIEAVRERCDQPISVDTTSARVAEACLKAGASIINDISAGREDADMFKFAASSGAPIILMHMLGEPATMQSDPQYGDVVTEVRGFLVERGRAAIAAGVQPERVVFDPGIGFGKTFEHNIALLRALDRFVEIGYPVMIGASRKRFLGKITGEADPSQRDVATAATTALGVAAGVRMIRVHDVRSNRYAADVAFAVRGRS